MEQDNNRKDSPEGIEAHIIKTRKQLKAWKKLMDALEAEKLSMKKKS